VLCKADKVTHQKQQKSFYQEMLKKHQKVKGDIIRVNTCNSV